MIITHNYTGKSLLELRKQYGTGNSGFYNSWWNDESFASFCPEAGKYKIDLGENLTNLTFTKQLKKIPKGFSLIHPAILVEAVLEHYEKTGKKLLENSWVRTSVVVSGDFHISVGGFGSHGLEVDDYWDDARDGGLGVSSARRLKTGKLESFDILEIKGKKYKLTEIK